MFVKHINFKLTGDYRERTTNGVNWCIWEVDNQRMIDPDNYIPYLQYIGDIPVVDCTSLPAQERVLTQTIEDRLSNIEDIVAELYGV